MFNIISKRVLVLTIISLLLISVLTIWYLSEDIVPLAEAREEALKHLTLSSRTSVADEYKDGFPTCDRMGSYDRFTALQPADLSDEEIEEAIELYDECGQNFPDRRTFSYEKMKESREEMEANLESLRGISGSWRDRFLSVWRELDENLLTQAETFERLSEIQLEYWEVEHQLRQGDITPEGREERFGDLNREANIKLETMRDVVNELKELRERERDVWSEIAN